MCVLPCTCSIVLWDASYDSIALFVAWRLCFYKFVIAYGYVQHISPSYLSVLVMLCDTSELVRPATGPAMLAHASYLDHAGVLDAQNVWTGCTNKYTNIFILFVQIICATTKGNTAYAMYFSQPCCPSPTRSGQLVAVWVSRRPNYHEHVETHEWQYNI